MGLDLGSLGNIFQRTGKLATGFDELFTNGGDKMDENDQADENYRYGRLNGSGANEYSYGGYNSSPSDMVTQHSGGGAMNTNTMIMIAVGVVVLIGAVILARK